MKKSINVNDWNRKEHYLFFSKFEEPFFGVTISVNCTIAYQQAKSKNISFFLYYLYRALRAANEVENFRYRIYKNEVYIYDSIQASTTVNRPNGTFGFSYIDYIENEHEFYESARVEMEKVRQASGLLPAVSGENVIHFSVLPWLNFTSLSHARSFSFSDSSPKISFGKMIEQGPLKSMPVSIHAHHGLMDGYHVGLFADIFQEMLDKK
ncbi:chloramphenicol acetyltransferase [Spirosoma aerolatum]|uniref:chloramphenicol acetyltransferase n=1 Tax=Spirosoma aerolatum TaxID=1211326 RepID=UPI0009ACBCB3|nr:chloramphenicol acetyltransferase [Spirosoma aerolatum]